MIRFSAYTTFRCRHGAVVVASNILVQFPLQGMLGGLSLADILTWGAFTYPFAFLVTDLANRRYGPFGAPRRVCRLHDGGHLLDRHPAAALRLGLIEFETAAGRLVRIAIASGAAFLTAQLLDVTVFNWLRRQCWWRAPIFATLAGSVVDTAIFFSIAFAAAFAFVGRTTILRWRPHRCSVCSAGSPRWVSWAIGDLAVKLPSQFSR